MNITVDNFKSEKIELSEEEVSMFGYNFDELGKVFSWHGRIFRAIYPQSVAYVKELLSCGLIDELIEKKLFPQTTLSPYTFDEFELILEHEKIDPVLYPSSWSFDMLKDAGICVLEVNMIARKYGYQTIDSHGFNVLFKETQPMFIDLGSFVKNNENPKGWLAYEQFLRYYYFPLRVFQSGNIYLGRAVMSQGKKFMPHSSYLQYRFSLLRLLNPRLLDLFYENIHKYKAFSHYSLQEVTQRAPQKLKGLLVYLKTKKIAPFQNVNLSKLKRKIQKTKLSVADSQWGDYHDQFFTKNGKLSATPRFERIAELVKDLPVSNGLEVGGNQGFFSEFLLQNTSIKKMTCSDYDEIAVNKMYNRLKNKDLPITPSILDVVSPLVLNYGPSLYQRYKSDVIFALALTHHIILTQKIPLNKLFQQFSKFSNRYVVTEFMPQGLYGPNAKHKYIPPDWYTLEWFKEEFEKEYTLLHLEQLEENRVLLIGEKKY